MEERFSGLMLPLAKGSMPDFGAVFATYTNDLKRAAEAARHALSVHLEESLMKPEFPGASHAGEGLLRRSASSFTLPARLRTAESKPL